MTINASCLSKTDNKTVVIGVGGTGCRVASALAKNDLSGSTLIAVDTDWASVRLAEVHRKVELRHASIYGLGSGGNTEWVQRCAEACLDELRETLDNPGFVLIVAGMGGGTGTGASPVIARLAAEAGAPVAAVVTLPAQWEGKRRKESAKEGLEALGKETGAMLAVPLEQVQKIMDGKTTTFENFYNSAQLLVQDCVAFLLGQRNTMEFAGLRFSGFQVITGHDGMPGNMPDAFARRLKMLAGLS